MQDESGLPNVIPVGEFLSPALSHRQANAYELKFAIKRVLSDEVQAWAREHMSIDPHGHTHRRGAYITTTLYCDTPGFDVFRKSASYRRRKFRLRRYGESFQIYLERKTKTGNVVRKKRSSIPLSELHFLESAVTTSDWEGFWFHRRVLFKGLGPSCVLSYERTAFGKPFDEGNMRLTLDRHLVSQRMPAWDFPRPGVGLPILSGQAILELKYQTALPTLFKDLLETFRLQPNAHSKYRSAMQMWGVKAARAELAYA